MCFSVVAVSGSVFCSPPYLADTSFQVPTSLFCALASGIGWWATVCLASPQSHAVPAKSTIIRTPSLREVANRIVDPPVSPTYGEFQLYLYVVGHDQTDAGNNCGI